VGGRPPHLAVLVGQTLAVLRGATLVGAMVIAIRAAVLSKVAEHWIGGTCVRNAAAAEFTYAKVAHCLRRNNAMLGANINLGE
jgi:hypothetical protein